MGLIFVFSLTSPIQATTIEKPIVDVLDLKVDGSAPGGVNVSLTKSFDVISRLIAHMEFVDNSVDFNDWGSGSPLTNGIKLFVNFSGTEISFLHGGGAIKANNQFGHAGFDITLLSDDKNPVGRVILARLSFDKFSPVGFDNRTGLLSEFFFQVQDDLTDANTTHIEVSIEGYQILRTNYFEAMDDFFYPNQIFILDLEDLKIDSTYGILISTNTNDPAWFNFTAKNTNQHMELFFQPDTKQVVNFALYENGVLVQQKTRFIMDNDINNFTPLLINIVFALAILLVGYIIFSFFISSKSRR